MHEFDDQLKQLELAKNLASVSYKTISMHLEALQESHTAMIRIIEEILLLMDKTEKRNEDSVHHKH